MDTSRYDAVKSVSNEKNRAGPRVAKKKFPVTRSAGVQRAGRKRRSRTSKQTIRLLGYLGEPRGDV